MTLAIDIKCLMTLEIDIRCLMTLANDIRRICPLVIYIYNLWRHARHKRGHIIDIYIIYLGLGFYFSRKL